MVNTLQREAFIRAYKDETGETEVDMHEVARFAVSKGWPLPKPSDPFDMLAKQFANAARLEIRHDPEHRKPISRVLRR